MSAATLTREGPLFIITLHHDDNRFSNEFISSLNAILDKVEATLESEKPDEAALVTMIAPSDKIFSNGLKLEVFFAEGKAYFTKYQDLMARFMSFPIPTVASLSGHAFAGGCMFAFCHDYRVMRSDRGFICMNEVDMPAALTPGMEAILKAKISSKLALRKMIMEGHRFNAAESLKFEMVDEIYEGPEKVIAGAKALAAKWAPKARAGKVYGHLKTELYTDAVRLLREMDLGFVKAKM
ncbi:hypothetical protein HDU76_002949 [Blyttiomyces sp. JEL0837]|nr:hypothetical protein HDU76_002949 [Blyttiomyces sp. JEL0837]